MVYIPEACGARSISSRATMVKSLSNPPDTNPPTDNSSTSSTLSGNTKQIAPSKNWCFTWNNYSEDSIDEIKSMDSSIVPKYVFQEEISESGTKHLQGYLRFATKKRPKSVFKSQSIHWEVARNVKASIAYCQKDDTNNGRQWFRGIEARYKIIVDKSWWKSWMDPIVKIIDSEPDHRTIHWFWEPKGCEGKTTFSKWVYLNKENVIILSGKGADMKNGIVNYVKTNGCHPKTVIINIPRSHKKYVSYTGIEEVKDMFFFSGKYEGGMVCNANPHVIVFANSEPEYYTGEELNMSMDKWNVQELK